MMATAVIAVETWIRLLQVFGEVAVAPEAGEAALKCAL